VCDFLAARGVEVSEDMVHEIGDRKQVLVERALERESVEAFPGSVRWVRHLREEGVRTAVVSSSTNAGDVLRSAGIADLFETTVSGKDIVDLGLSGKPAPDGFLRPPAAWTPRRSARS
jgi:alpha,alpha-trehalose phosphorylase